MKYEMPLNNDSQVGNSGAMGYGMKSTTPGLVCISFVHHSNIQSWHPPLFAFSRSLIEAFLWWWYIYIMLPARIICTTIDVARISKSYYENDHKY